jgi:protein-S-isoprenylcysteine O-methyltransferase Ste14
MPLYAYLIIAAGTILWALPFPIARSKYKGALTLDRGARWGVALQAIGYTVLWQGSFWIRSPAPWQTYLSALLLVAACALSWMSAITLGKQFRVDAGIIAGHRLVRSGPYRIVRHPIYTSMLALLLGTGVLIAPWYLLLAGVLLFLVGTVIRTRVEDTLLEARFGDEFRQYRGSVKGFIPFVA